MSTNPGEPDSGIPAPSPARLARRRLERLAFELGRLRDHVEGAMEDLKELRLILNPECRRWRCDGCEYEKNFTKPMTAEVCGTCPRCKGSAFSAVRVP